jgi:hypothetical protein
MSNYSINDLKIKFFQLEKNSSTSFKDVESQKGLLVTEGKFAKIVNNFKGTKLVFDPYLIESAYFQNLDKEKQENILEAVLKVAVTSKESNEEFRMSGFGKYMTLLFSSMIGAQAGCSSAKDSFNKEIMTTSLTTALVTSTATISSFALNEFSKVNSEFRHNLTDGAKENEKLKEGLQHLVQIFNEYNRFGKGIVNDFGKLINSSFQSFFATRFPAKILAEKFGTPEIAR